MKLSNALLYLLLLLVLIFFHTRGVITHDEGYILHSAEKFIDGQLPYRDFSFVYTPGSIYLTALSFLIFSPSILASRMLMTLVSFTTTLLIFRSTILTTKNKVYATLAAAIYVVWGPMHTNFSWPVMFVILATLATVFFILNCIITRNSKYLFFAGISAFLVFLFKQNFGVILLIPVLVFFLTKSVRERKFLMPFVYGYTWSGILFASYLLYTNSFASFIRDFFDFTVLRIVTIGALTTPFVYEDNFLQMLGRTAIYLLPAIVSILCFLVLLTRRRFHLLFIPTLVFFYYIVGIRPTTDYVHLTPLYSLIGITIALFLRFNVVTNFRLIAFLLSFALIIGGLFSSLFRGYYKWDSPLIYHNRYLENERINIFVNDKFYGELTELLDITKRHSKIDDYMLVNSYDPLFYFVTQRREPTHYNFLLNDIDPKLYYKKTLSEIVAKEINILILNKDSLQGLPIKDYIEKHYSYNKTVYDFDIYVRR